MLFCVFFFTIFGIFGLQVFMVGRQADVVGVSELMPMMYLSRL